MEFSIERKASIKKRELAKDKEDMIFFEKLHINDVIDYERFSELYLMYGKDCGLAEDEFADIFLDISKTDFYDLRKRSKSRVLKRTVVTDQEIEQMKMKLILDFKLKPEDQKHYSELLEMYNSVSTKLSFVDFAERVFDIAQQTVSRISLEDSRYAVILSKTNKDYFDAEKRGDALSQTIRNLNKKQRAEKKLKTTIAEDMALHMNTAIKKDEFEELYKNYGAGYTEKEFAENILGIEARKAKGLIEGKTKDAKIWTSETLSLDELLLIRARTIKDEKLHVNEKISYERFKRIYKKHAGMLSEVDFALEILDIPRARYNDLSKGKCESLVLSTIEVPDKACQEIKSKIKQNENVYRGKPITYEELVQFHRKYGGILNESDFGVRVLEMDPEAITALKREDIKTSWILKGEENEKSPEDIKRLRQIVIKEEKLHIGDRMTGQRFTEIYEKYGLGMSKNDFALQILDIKDYRLNMILRDENSGTAMLTEEKVSKEELKELRKAFIKSGEHCMEDKIDYQEFLRLYNVYGGKLTESMFARKVLYISTDCLRAIKGNPELKTEIFYRAKFSDAYIANLKAKVIKDNLLFYKHPITLPYFNRLYKDAHTILSKPDFAEKILEVSRQSYWDLENKKSNYFIALSKSGSKENLTKFYQRQSKILRSLLIAGRDYGEIEEHVCMPREELLGTIEELYGTEFDKDEVNYRYIYRSLREGRELDEERISDFYDEEIEEIQGKVARDKEIEGKSKRCEAIMDEISESPRSLRNLNSFINDCRINYENYPTEMPESVLDCLQSSIEYLDRNINHTLFFIKLCIGRMDYTRARSLVSFNMLDTNLSFEERGKLQAMRNNIKQAEERRQLLDKKIGPARKDKIDRYCLSELAPC